MKHILRATRLPLGLLIFIILGTFLPIIYRDSLSITASFIILAIVATAGIYFFVLLFKALAAYTDNTVFQKILHKIDPTQQEMINDQRRKEHRAKFHSTTSEVRTINFFGSRLQCTIYAPDYKRAKKFYYQLPKELKETGGEFYYSSKGQLHKVQ